MQVELVVMMCLITYCYWAVVDFLKLCLVICNFTSCSLKNNTSVYLFPIFVAALIVKSVILRNRATRENRKKKLISNFKKN